MPHVWKVARGGRASPKFYDVDLDRHRVPELINRRLRAIFPEATLLLLEVIHPGRRLLLILPTASNYGRI